MNDSLMAGVIINGLLVGALWGLLGLGKNLILGTMKFVNFAHANFALLGMYVLYVAWLVVPIDPYLLIPVVLVVLALVGFLLDRPFVRPLVRLGQWSQIIATWAISAIIMYGLTLIFGPDPQSINSAWPITGITLPGDIFVTYASLMTFVISVAAILITWLIINHTSFGVRIRATAQNRASAVYYGINVESVYGRAFALTIVTAGLCGALYAIETPFDPNAAVPLFMIMFVVSVLGGLGSMLGNLLGGFVVGVLQGVTILYLPSQLENAVVYVVFLGLLLYRPQGILGDVSAVREGLTE
jgi:branched-chain amino acid transport system permease protein